MYSKCTVDDETTENVGGNGIGHVSRIQDGYKLHETPGSVDKN